MSSVGEILSHLKPTKTPQAVNLDYRDITSIGIVDPIFHKIKELSLNHNKISSLQGIQQFKRLRVLKLNFNKIKSQMELLKVTG